MRLEADSLLQAASPVVLGALVLTLAVQQAVLALLVSIGLPTEVVRLLRFTKEGLLGALCLLAALASWRATRPRLDVVDGAALGFLTVAVTYLLLGVTVGASLFPGVTRDIWLHLVGFRSLASAPIVLLAVRSLRLSGRARSHVASAIVAVAAGSGVVAAVQLAAPEAWMALADRLFAYDEYQRAVFGRDLPDTVLTWTSIPGATVVRAGGLMFDHLQLGFLLLPGFSIALSRVVVARGRELAAWGGAVALVAIGMVATGTRSVLIGAGAGGAALVFGWPAGDARRRAVRLASVTAVAVTALAIPTGVATRMVAGILASDASSADRLSSLELGLQTVASHPLGKGIASTAETAPRSDGIGLVVENAYLDVAVQIGVLGLLVLVCLLTVLVSELWRRRSSNDLALPGLATVVGLGVGAMFLPVWLMFETTWAAFALIGLALPRRGTPSDDALSSAVA